MYAFDKMLENLRRKICTGKRRLKGSFSVIYFGTVFFFFFLTFSLIILAQGNLLMKFPDDTKLEGTVKTEKDKDVT